MHRQFARLSFGALINKADGPAVSPTLVTMLDLDAVYSDAKFMAESKTSRSFQGWLRYGGCYGSEHALSGGSVAMLATFLCHPQYLHVHGPYLRTAELGDEYARAGRLDEDADEEAELNWCWSAEPEVQCRGLREYGRIFLQHNRRWAVEPELVYQYAASYPDNTVVCQHGRSLLPWYLEWKNPQVWFGAMEQQTTGFGCITHEHRRISQFRRLQQWQSYRQWKQG